MRPLNVGAADTQTEVATFSGHSRVSPLASLNSTSQWQGSGAHQHAKSRPAIVCSRARNAGCIISQRSYIAMHSVRSLSVALRRSLNGLANGEPLRCRRGIGLPQ